MAIVVIKGKLTSDDIKKAREEHGNYIKITTDLGQGFVVIGGEFHADAEELLLRDYASKQKDIWGGGYNFDTSDFNTNAVINIRQPDNPSSEIINPDIRSKFFKLVKQTLLNIDKL